MCHSERSEESVNINVCAYRSFTSFSMTFFFIIMRKILSIFVLLSCIVTLSANPIHGLLERIDKGASKKFIIQQQKSDVDFFELDQKGNKVVVRGNNYVSIATGINWYLKYHAGKG